MTLERVVMSSVFAGIGAGILVVLIRALVLRRLKNRHPVLWQAVGSPRWIIDPTREDARPFNDLLWDPARQPEGDRLLAILLATVRLLTTLVVASILIMFPLALDDSIVQRLDAPIAKQIENASWLLLIVMALATVLTTMTMFRRLCKRHPEKWIELGKPSFFFQRRIRIFRYLWFGEHRTQEDHTLHVLVLLIRSLTLVGISLLLLAASLG